MNLSVPAVRLDRTKAVPLRTATLIFDVGGTPVERRKCHPELTEPRS
jgi:hypothetical protein